MVCKTWCEWWIAMLVASGFSISLCLSQKLRPTQLQRALLHLNTNEEFVILTRLWLQQEGDNVKHSAGLRQRHAGGCLTPGCGGSTGEKVKARVRWCEQVKNVSLWCYLVNYICSMSSLLIKPSFWTFCFCSNVQFHYLYLNVRSG